MSDKMLAISPLEEAYKIYRTVSVTHEKHKIHIKALSQRHADLHNNLVFIEALE